MDGDRASRSAVPRQDVLEEISTTRP